MMDGETAESQLDEGGHTITEIAAHANVSEATVYRVLRGSAKVGADRTARVKAAISALAYEPLEPARSADKRMPTISDVAASAGVSVPTVSRVLTGAAKVSAELTDRVMTAITALDYRPSETARALVSRRPTTIAILSSDTTIYGYSATIRGIESAARLAGYAVTIVVLDGTDEASARRAVDAACRVPLAGVIVLKFDAAGVATLPYLPHHLPTVVASGELDSRYTQAALDEAAGGREITEYLLSLGHQTVHHVAVPPSRAEDGRTTGWRDALKAAGVAVPEVIAATWDPNSGVPIGKQLVAREDVTAVLCGNDEIAMGVIAGIVDAGARVPEDISVAGFDDHPLARVWRPAITTVAQDFDDLGRRSFSLLQSQFDESAGTQQVTSMAIPSLIRRASAAPPRG